MEELKCSECGSSVSREDETCSKCGYPIYKQVALEKKQKRNKILVILAIVGGIAALITMVTLVIIKKIEYDNFKPQYYFCRSTDSSNNYADVNSISPKEVSVRIEKNHNDTSGYTGSLKRINDDYCKYGDLLAKEKQENYHLRCGNTQDIITYTYKGKIDGAIEQLSEDKFKCVLREASNSPYLEELKDSYWCIYTNGVKQFSFYTFDDTMVKRISQSTGEPYITTYDYYLNDDKLTFASKSYDTIYTYDKEKKRYTQSSSDKNYFEKCDKPIVYDKVKVISYIKYGKNYSKSYYVSRYNDYTVEKVECTNGNSGTWDTELWEFIPDKNIESECSVYFK